ncbi:MAG: hypothetical protein U9N79_10290 [Actinomycetota bacterium]|nr:hypothetical protein [Actinomycetota bacterium]
MNLRPATVDIEMTTHPVVRTDTRRPLMWGALLAVLWVAVAILRPGTTFHLAPFLIAAAPPALVALDDGATADMAVVVRAGAIAGALSLVTAMLLLAIGAMNGPAFEMFPGPVVEAVVFTAVGAIGGIGFGLWRAHRSISARPPQQALRDRRG